MIASNGCRLLCRHCRFYSPQGRRGGMCSQLGVMVKADWNSCYFASPAFEQKETKIPHLVLLEKSFSLSCVTPAVQWSLEKHKTVSSERQNTG
ncbi:MAG: hypothetical protein NZ901_01675 [Geminocystis sp.]|nr:hypothetical protein [Geminocystis sp.]MCS7146878.1 hypothetical protein [Geminocystis sp.]MDW8115703.1 hypothetical protein [Geminocystis sp.]MDW8463246.1 hypothetical protein [Geminocystis sp.]